MKARVTLAATAALLLCTRLRAAQPVDDEATILAKQLANPVSSLISVPFQANEDFNLGPTSNGYKFTLNFQPVVPVSISKDWNIIVRTILPFISQHDVYYKPVPPFPGVPNSVLIQFPKSAQSAVQSQARNAYNNAIKDHPQNRSQDGLGDTTQSFFLSPKAPGPFDLIWGVGPVLLYPTATQDLLGSGKWGMGPTFVVLRQTGGWTVGALANQIWSIAGNDDRKNVSSAFLQPFIAYTTKTHTTFTLNTESTYDWEDSQWSVPLNLMVSQILKIGKLPVSIQLGGRYYAVSPNGGPNWGVRLNFTLLFPTERPGEQKTAAK